MRIFIRISVFFAHMRKYGLSVKAALVCSTVCSIGVVFLQEHFALDSSPLSLSNLVARLTPEH